MSNFGIKALITWLEQPAYISPNVSNYLDGRSFLGERGHNERRLEIFCNRLSIPNSVAK